MGVSSRAGPAAGPQCRECGKVHWLERRSLDVCTCGGALDNVQRRRERTRGGFRTKKQAQEALDKAKVALQQGEYVAPSKLTVAEYLLRMWLPSIAASIRPSTYKSYAMHVENYIVPMVGSAQLQRLSPDAIGAMYRDLLDDGKLRRAKPKKRKAKGEDAAPAEPAKRGMSPVTVRHTHAVLHRALRDAVRRQCIKRNPADAVDPPKASGTDVHEMKVWTAQQTVTFLEATRDDRLNRLWRLMVDRGLRRGEACGLRWEDVDLAEVTFPDSRSSPGRISIRRALIASGSRLDVSETKTKRGRRVVPLSADTVAVLKQQAAQQAQDAHDWGAAWTETGYVFTQENGQPLNPDRITKLFTDAEKTVPVPRIRLHDLRHTCAVLHLKAGVPVKVVSELLGHSTTAFTMDVYQHVLPGMQEDAAERISALLAPSDESSRANRGQMAVLDAVVLTPAGEEDRD